MNSREKGKRGERMWRDELREAGFKARRGQQFSGSSQSPDVVCHDLWWMHFEVKCVERLNIEDAMDQARHDAGGAMPIVAHKRSHRRWLVTMEAKDFFRLVREFEPPRRGDAEVGTVDRQDACPTAWRRIEGEPGDGKPTGRSEIGGTEASASK